MGLGVPGAGVVPLHAAMVVGSVMAGLALAACRVPVVVALGVLVPLRVLGIALGAQVRESIDSGVVTPAAR